MRREEAKNLETTQPNRDQGLLELNPLVEISKKVLYEIIYKRRDVERDSTYQQQ